MPTERIKFGSGRGKRAYERLRAPLRSEHLNPLPQKAKEARVDKRQDSPSDFYCESDCMSEGRCLTQCHECEAEQYFDDTDTGEDTNVEDSYGR